MRFRYDQSRPKFDVVTAIELGDIDRGYKAIDINGKDMKNEWKNIFAFE